MRLLAQTTALAALLLFTSIGRDAAAQDDSTRRAKQAFKDGTTFFDLGQFDKAIEAWQRGYQLKSDPSFLYNIAQAYRLSGDLPRALFFYQNYLQHSQNPPNRAQVEERIAELQRQIEEAKIKARMAREARAAEEKERPPEYDPHKNVPSVVDAPPERESRPMRIALGVGVDTWASGISRGGDPSFGFGLDAGYAFRALSSRRVETSLGARFGVGFLSDQGQNGMASDTITVVSIGAGPRVRFHFNDAFSSYLEVIAGVGILSGIQPTSAVFSAPVGTISGALSAFELRPALGLEYALSPALGLFLSPALTYTKAPSSAFTDSALVRFSILVGGAVYF